MAYASSLPESRFNAIHQELENHSFNAAKIAYEACFERAKSKKSRKACAGHYPNQWSTLLIQWCSNKVPNLVVYDALSLGYVPEYQLAYVTNH